MLARTKWTYRKLDKVFTGTPAECRAILREHILYPFPAADVKEITRGDNRIGYFRPCGGTQINDKLYMLHWNQDGTVSLFV